MKNFKIAFGSVLAVALLFSSSNAAWWNLGMDDEMGAGLMTQIIDEDGEVQDVTLDAPDNWGMMSPEERREFMRDLLPQKLKRTADGDGRVDRPEGQGKKVGPKVALRKQARNFLRKARKGKRFKKFTGQLKARKKFKDEGKMRNPEAVSFMQQRGIMEGYEDGSFGADREINRAESLKVLLESLGEGPDEVDEDDFTDVPKGAWYAGYVRKAKRRGIVKGYEDGSFKPGAAVNQVELLKLAFESFDIDLDDYEVSDLPGDADVNAWYAKYLQYALDNDLLDEDDVSLGEGMTREMFAEVISRLIQQQEGLE